MNKSIRLLVEGFFDDEIFDVGNDIKSDIEDLGKYYDYKVGDIYYNDKKPYAVCCGKTKYFYDDKPRFCLLNISQETLQWRMCNTEVKKLKYFEFKDFYLKSFNDFKHINENGYENTQIIKNNYNIFEFPAFEECIELGDNVYLPAIDELQMMYLNKDKLSKYIGKYSFSGSFYCSSTQYSGYYVCCITGIGNVGYYSKTCRYWVCPFYHLD